MEYCNLCNNNLSLITKTETKHSDCRACNLGVFNSSLNGCSCSYYTYEYTEYICKKIDKNIE